MSAADIVRRSVALAAVGLKTRADAHSSGATAERRANFKEIPGKAIELSSPSHRYHGGAAGAWRKHSRRSLPAPRPERPLHVATADGDDGEHDRREPADGQGHHRGLPPERAARQGRRARQLPPPAPLELRT